MPPINVVPLEKPAVADSKQGNQSAARERALKAFMEPKTQAQAAAAATANTTQEHPVSNPSQVSPEEMTAIKAPAAQSQGQEPTSESPKQNLSESPQAETDPAKDDSNNPPLSSQFAVLARKEKALRAKVQAQEQAIKAKEAAIAEREAAIKAKEAEYQSDYIPKSKLTQDTISTLLEAGIDYDQITQMVLNQSQAQVDPATKLAIQRLEEKVASQQRAIEESNKQKEESIQNQYKEAVRQIHFDASKLVKNDDSYELIRTTNSVNDVVDLIEKTYKEDGVILSVEEAATAVEDYLVERLSKYANTNKIQQRLKANAKPQEPQKLPQKQEATTQTQLKTLTNSLGSTKPLSARERAIAAMEGRLKR